MGQRHVLFFTILLTLFGKAYSNECCFSPWQGFYVSGQVGAGEIREHMRMNDNFFNTLGPILLGSHFNHKSTGVIGGGALGYNFQIDDFIVGIEGGAVYANLQKTRKSPFFPDTDVFSSKVNCIANAKLRLGYAYDSLLLFITGGWAGSNHELKMSDTSSDVFAKLNSWSNGWTLGTGFDYKCFDCISLGLSYDYYELRYRHKKATCAECGTGVGLGSPKINNHSYLQTLTLRLNYLFNL